VQAQDNANTAGNDVSDLDWMKSRMTKGIREGKDFEQSDDEADGLDDIEMANASKVALHLLSLPYARSFITCR